MIHFYKISEKIKTVNRYEIGGAEVEADGSTLEVIESESHGNHLLYPLLRPMESNMEKLPLIFYTPCRF
jgi:hypothetical protein